MANLSKTASKPPSVGKVYIRALLLVFALFTFHVLMLFDVAALLLPAQAWLTDRIGPHGIGKLIILGCFCVLFVAHIAEAATWGLFLRWQGLVPSLSDGLYFAGATITTLGYGDVLLPRPWRQIGALLAIAGVLKFGCSTAFLFVVMQGVWARHL